MRKTKHMDPATCYHPQKKWKDRKNSKWKPSWPIEDKAHGRDTSSNGKATPPLITLGNQNETLHMHRRLWRTIKDDTNFE